MQPYGPILPLSRRGNRVDNDGDPKLIEAISTGYRQFSP